MTKFVALLGRQPALGLAELESLYGAEALQPISNQAVQLDTEAEVEFSRIGGTIKLARLITILDTTEWNVIEKHLQESVVPHAKHLPDGKMSLGLSVYGLNVKPSRINATALDLKKILKNSGRSVRVIPNKTAELSSAQVLHNNLTGERAWELLFIQHGSQTYMAQTTNVQDITAYTARDQARPKRDARVGMLPPKLAQIIINLSVGQEVDGRRQTVDGIKTPDSFTILDPFCGTGVVLQEALLMGYKAYGTDLERRMFEYSQENLEWLVEKFRPSQTEFRVSIGDATQCDWVQPINFVATETYLGRPFSALPNPAILEEVRRDVDTIHKKFLKNLARQTQSGTRICIAVPAWKTPGGFIHLPVLDSLEELGYTRISFVHARKDQLIYHRPEQIVGRELVVLQRK